jgi:hypothetical protein
MTVAVYSPNGSISVKDYSHRAAWPKMMLDSHKVTDFVLQPEDLLSNYEEVWLYLGMEFNGSLNLFGGANAENTERLIRLLEAKRVCFLSTEPGTHEAPRLGTIAKERLGKKGVSQEWQDAPWDRLDQLCQGMAIIHQRSKPHTVPSNPHLVVGDSHALSLYDGYSTINRYDHKTLHGALKEGLEKFVLSNPYPWKKVTLCFGNIDMQHHLVRLGKSATVELAEKYVVQASQIKAERVEIFELLPIFPETRKIATTGYYKGKAWGGTWAQRNELRQIFNDVLLDQAVPHDQLIIGRWPQYIYGQDGEFSGAYQERPKGVHLSWEHRRQTWSQE